MWPFTDNGETDVLEQVRRENPMWQNTGMTLRQLISPANDMQKFRVFIMGDKEPLFTCEARLLRYGEYSSIAKRRVMNYIINGELIDVRLWR